MGAKNPRAKPQAGPEVSKEDLLEYSEVGRTGARTFSAAPRTSTPHRGAAADQGHPRSSLSKTESSRSIGETVTRRRRGSPVEGTILLHRDGYGFVMPAEKIPGSTAIFTFPPALVGSAMNGDRVKVEITLRKPGGRAEGRVVTVEKRARDTIVGQLRFDGEVFFVAPSDEKLPAKFSFTKT